MCDTSLVTLHNYGSTFDVTHVISCTRLPLLSLTCIEKERGAWGQGYFACKTVVHLDSVIGGGSKVIVGNLVRFSIIGLLQTLRATTYGFTETIAKNS